MHRSDLIGRLAKYQISIQTYDITIEYRAGKHNTLCDFLSRYPIKAVSAIERFTLPTLEDIRQSQAHSQYRELLKYFQGKTHQPPPQFTKELINLNFSTIAYITLSTGELHY